MEERDVTFCITYMSLRNDDLAEAVDSVRQYYPGSQLLTQDTGGNLSLGRNLLVNRVQTPYMFLMEEDMRLGPSVDIHQLERMLRHGCLVAGVGLYEPTDRKARSNYKIRYIAADFDDTGDNLVLRDSTRLKHLPDGGSYIAADYITNVWLGVTNQVRLVPWNESLPLAEHEN